MEQSTSDHGCSDGEPNGLAHGNPPAAFEKEAAPRKRLPEDPGRAGKANAFIPMYVGDMLRDTGHLTNAQFGAYHLLIYRYWVTQRPLKNDDTMLRRLTRCTPEEWKEMRPILEDLFQADEHCWYHKRIEAELEKASESARRRSEAGKRGNAVRWCDKKSQPDRDATPTGSQSESQSHSESESKPQQGRVPYSNKVPASAKKREDELMARCREVLGSEEMQKNGGIWRTRAREDADKLSRVLDDVALQVKEGRTIGNIAAYATDLFRNRFKSH